VSRESSFRNQFLFLLYYSVVLLFILPIWLSGEFITLNGPLYISEAVAFKRSIIDGSFMTRFSVLELIGPDSFVQLGYLFFISFLNIGIAIKIMASLQVFFFLTVFRSIILSLNQRAIYRPFLIYPFVFNLPFVLGLLNFSWGIVWWMISLLFLIKLPNHTSLRNHAWIYWFFLALFCYLSSLLSIALMLGFSFLWILFQKETQNRRILFQHWVPAVVPFLGVALYVCLSPSLLLRFETSFTQRLYSWFSCEAIVTFQELERLTAWPVGIVLTGLLLFAITKVFSPQNAEPKRLFWQRILTVASIACIGLFFFFPDWMNGSDKLLVKIQLLGSLCLLMVMATIRLKKVFMIPLGILFLGMSIVRLRQQVQNWEELGIAAAEYLEVKDKIPNHAQVVTFNFSKNKFHAHFGLLWNANQEIRFIDHATISSDEIYVYTWGANNAQLLADQLSNQAIPIFSSSKKNGNLYKIKKPELRE
jgi:hypothetical protein